MRVATAIVLSAAAITSLPAQDTTSTTPNIDSVSTEALFRDPQRAKMLGTLLPGAGHIYAGEYLRGYVIWVTTATSFIMSPYVYEAGLCSFRFTTCDPGPQWLRLALGGVIAAGGVWSWVESVRDAPRAANRANAKRTDTLKLSPFIEPSLTHRVQWRAGLSMRW